MSKIIACLWFTLIAFHSLLIASSYSLLFLLEPLTGFEPVTSSLPRRGSNQLSYKGGCFFTHATSGAAAPQLLCPSLHLAVVEQNLANSLLSICGVRTLNLRFNVPNSTPHLKFKVLPCTWALLRENFLHQSAYPGHF